MKKYRNYIIAIISLIVIAVAVCFVPISARKLIPLVEKQAAADFGIEAHLEQLVLRIGPQLKLKTPIMHLMYEDGQKFAQLDGVKFYIPWSSVIRKNPKVKVIRAKNLTVRMSSDDEGLNNFMGNLEKKDISELPNIDLKGYKITYSNKQKGDDYLLTGQELNLHKIINFKSFKLSTKGYLAINKNQYINYDISLLPNLNFDIGSMKFDLIDFIDKIKLVDFHSDLIADLKLYKNQCDNIQASGFVNVDNISVFDASGKNPKSFVYLTLLGDKASILSNIYTSQNKKVYLDGMINNSNKPVLDLKVKTDEIELGSLYEKLKIFTGLSDLKNIDSVDGLLNANFTLKGDLKKIKSAGYMKISNASLKAGNFKIDKINSDIDFSNNTVNIAHASGYVNKAPIILKGSINNALNLELLMSKVELKHFLPEQFGVNGGIISLAANITGALDNVIHKENLQIDNFSAQKDGKSLTLDSLKIDTNKNNTAYIDNIVFTTPETEIIKIPSMKLLVERDKITLPETNIFMPNSKVTITGNVANYNNKDMAFMLGADGFVSSKDIKSLNSQSVKYPVKCILTGNKALQNVNAQVLLENADIFDEPAILNLTSKLNYDKNSSKYGMKLEDLSVSGFKGQFTEDLKSNLKGQKKLVVSGIIEDLKKPVFKNFRVNIPQILNLHLYDTTAQLKGDLFLNGEYLKPEIVGQIFIHSLFNESTQTAVNNGSIDFNKNTASINAPSVKTGDSSIGVNASVNTDLTDGLVIKNLNIKSKFINTDTLLMYKDVPMLKSIPIEIQDGKFYSERISASVYGSSVYLTAFTGDIRLKDNLMNIKNISAEMFNGKLAGALDFNLKDESFGSKIMARGVSAAPIFDIISSNKETISGVMDFDTLIKGNLVSKKSLNGDVKFEIRNGRMSTLGKLEHLLYAQNVVADSMLRASLGIVTKAVTLKDTGLFKYMRGDISIVNGVANIKGIQTMGPLMALFIKGQYYPENNYANLVVLGRISDEVISGMGAFADFSLNKLMIMLTGEENKSNIRLADMEKLPQLSAKNTREFRSIINGAADKASSVLSFNWISFSQKSLKQKEVPMTNVKVPSFVEELPY